MLLEEELVKKTFSRVITITPPPSQKFTFTPPGYHWFKIIPYEDGVIPYDKINTILYFKRDKFIECYVRTNNAPSDLVEMGYAIPKSPVDIVGILGESRVFCCTLFAKRKHDYYFVDFIINDTNRFFRSMPNCTALAVYLHTPENLKRMIAEECLKLRGNDFRDLQVSNNLYNLVLHLLETGNCHRLRGIKPEDFEKERIFPEIYALQLTLLAYTKEALTSLKQLMSRLTDVEIDWKSFEKPWIVALEKASNPVKDRFRRTPVTFTASSDALRNWLILPDCSICNCIPRGTVPAEAISRHDGFRVGLGVDNSELKLREEDFLEHCAIVGRDDDLLATIVKNLGLLNSVIIISINDTISRILLHKGVKCTVYNKDIKVNPFDLCEEDYANTLIDTLGLQLSTSPRSLAKALTYLNKTIGYFSPLLLLKLITDVTKRRLILSDSTLSSSLNIVYQNLYNFSRTALEFCSEGFISNYTNIPLQKILSVAGVTVFDNLQFPDAHVLLVRLLTEIIAQPKYYPTYIVLLLPNLSEHSQFIYNLFKFKKYGVHVIICTTNVEDHKILDDVGITFRIEGDRAYARVFGEGTTVITIDRIKPNPVRENDPEFQSPLPCPDYRIKLFGQALKYVDPEDALRSIVLYEIYKEVPVNVQRLIKKLEDEGIDVKSILSWLQERDFVIIHDDTTVEYNNGFEKWFKSAIPAIESDQIIRAIVDYYFSRSHCVIPVKQTPGVERPDLMAVPFTSRVHFNFHGAIPVEVELSLDKGEKSLQQAHKNMIKNPEFLKKHVVTLIKFRDKIMDIYNSVDDNVKERVEILFYDGKKILEAEEVEFAEIVEKTDDNKDNDVEKKREEEKQKRKKDTKTLSLLEFVKDEKDEGNIKVEAEDVKIRDDVEVEEPVTKTAKEMSDEERDESVKDEETVEGGLMVVWNNKIYVLEEDKESERAARFVNDFLEGKRENIRIVEKDRILKVLDEKGNVIAKAKIIRTL